MEIYSVPSLRTNQQRILFPLRKELFTSQIFFRHLIFWVSHARLLARTTLVHPTPSFISQPKSLFPLYFILSISSFIPVLFSVLPVTDCFLTSSPCCFFVVYCTSICPLELRTDCSLNELPKKENHGCHVKWQLQCTISRRCPGTLWIKKIAIHINKELKCNFLCRLTLSKSKTSSVVSGSTYVEYTCYPLRGKMASIDLHRETFSLHFILTKRWEQSTVIVGPTLQLQMNLG